MQLDTALLKNVLEKPSSHPLNYGGSSVRATYVVLKSETEQTFYYFINNYPYKTSFRLLRLSQKF